MTTAACSDDGGPGPAAASPPDRSTTSAPEPRSTDVLADGRHPARIVGLDLTGPAVSIDVVQLFLGAAASSAAEEDGAAEVPPPNDVWIRNENPLVRTLPVARGVPVVTNTLTAAETGSSTRDVRISLVRLAQLDHVGQALFGVTVRDGVVTRLDDHYLP